MPVPVSRNANTLNRLLSQPELNALNAAKPRTKISLVRGKAKSLRGKLKREKYFILAPATPNAILPYGTSRPEKNVPNAAPCWFKQRTIKLSAVIKSAILRRLKKNKPRFLEYKIGAMVRKQTSFPIS